MAVDNTNPAEQELTAGLAAPAVLDPQHAGDIVAALGTLKQNETDRPRSWRRKLRLLLIILGPGLIVMGGGNDAGGVQVYLQMGQDYGMRLLWTLVLLFPILYVCQEMVLRLGVVSGVGHGRLIFARFGKFWGCFAVGDLFIINAVTVAAEFIGVEQGLSYFGLSSAVAVPVTAALLFLVMAGGSYRYWERFLIGLVIADFVVFPIACFVHTSVASSAAGAIPSLPGGVNAGILLLAVAIIGTTVEPWQMFFQQSSVVDKRITPRWINYERMDTLIGVLIEVAGALVLMAAAAFGLAHTAASGNFTDLGATMSALQQHVGRGAGALLALVTIDGSLIGANLTALTIGYTLGDVTSGKMRHSLHWKPRQAPFFYGLYAVLVTLGAIVTLAWANQVGVVINGAEALNGVLLPSALVFLVLLANDRPVLGPWANSTALNWVCGVVVWAVTTFSLAPVVTTFFPDVTLTQITGAFIACTVLGLAAAAVIWRLRPSRGQPAGPGPDTTRRPPGMDRAEWRAILRERRLAWRTPRIDTLERPAISAARWVGLLVLRAYIVFAIVIVVIKLVQTATAR
jgi:Mn2+/Fe2+ NRAMP family transporter